MHTFFETPEQKLKNEYFLEFVNNYLNGNIAIFLKTLTFLKNVHTFFETPKQKLKHEHFLEFANNSLNGNIYGNSEQNLKT